MDKVSSPTRMESRTQSSYETTSSSRFAGKRVHFIGIGGSGMNGLARILLDCGAIVSGSDPNPGAATLDLARRNVRISRDQLGELPVAGHRSGGANRRRPGSQSGISGRQATSTEDDQVRGTARADHAGAVRRRRGRHAWQEHHHRDDGLRPDAVRCGSELCRRRDGQPTRWNGKPKRRGSRVHCRGMRIRSQAFTISDRRSPYC